MRLGMFRVSLVAAACLLWLASAAAAQCEPDGDVQFVCGPVSPEDLATVPESPWVIVSGMENDGFLYATDTRDHRSAVLFPSATFGSRPDASYSSCRGPVTGGFQPHGLSLRPGRDGIHTLYVVRHGAREAISAGWGTRSLIRLSRGLTPVQKDAVDVGFHIDNIRWAPDGSLLAAGHLGNTPESIFACVGQQQCDGVTSRVAKVDPEDLIAEEIVRYPSNQHVILGTVALQVGDEIWLGGVAGADRIARFPAPSR